MKTLLDEAMRKATALTRRGTLVEATQAIQRALLGRQAGPPEPRVAPTRRPPARPLPDATVATVAPFTTEHAFVDGRFTHDALVRDFKLFVPADTSARPGLVVMLHGCTQTPDDFARGTRANDAAPDADCLVLYPAQSKRANANGCWNWFERAHQSRDRGETAFLAALTRKVMADYGVDPARVYVAGLSAGGAMAAILAAEYPDLFAAACVHSGLPAGAASNMSEAFEAMRSGAKAAATAATRRGCRGGVPTIVFHGEQDHTVHAANADAVAAVAFEGVAESRRDAPVVAELVDTKGRRVTRTSHAIAGRTVVETWTVRSAGHAWFGGSKDGSYTDPHGIDATREMFRFFAENPRPGTA